MLLTLGAAGATLLAMLAVIGIPAIDACNGDARGLVQCLRGLVDDKFDLGIDPPPAATPNPPPAAEPVVAEVPAPAEVAPRIQIADSPPVKATVETTRSLVPQTAEKPIAPDMAPPQVVIAPKVVPTPDLAPEPPPVADLSAPEEPDAPPAETIALASIVEPAPSFVPPAPLVAVDGVPPDLQVAVVEPAPIALPDAAPDIALPATPDLTVALPSALAVAVPAAVPVESSAAGAPSFVPPAAPISIGGVPPDLQVAVAEPEPVALPEPEPDAVLPTTPDLLNVPPPDLTVAAVDPVVPAEAAPAELPARAPSIDAVEIDGDGNFIAGNGPAGANMRLYVDGIPVGVSPVEGGRWLVEGTDLLTDEQQTLKVQALDPLTGKVIGEATAIFEGPVSAEPEVPAEEVEPPASEPEASIEPEVIEPAEVPVEEVAAPAEVPADEPVVPAEAAAAPLPEIAPVVPAGESSSVTILKPADDTTITTLTTGKPSDDAVVTLGAAPATPAVIASFTLPRAATADITVLRAIPIGDPGAGRFVSGKAIIRRGDTLWDIAHRYYGHGIHYRTIFRANRELIARPGKIYPGQVFELPLVCDD